MEKIFTLQEVADILHMARQSVSMLAQENKLSYFSPDHGKHKYLFPESAINAYISSRMRGIENGLQ